MEQDNATRVCRAVSAAQAIAHRHGVPAHQPRVLHDANNVVVHLAPSRVVAKVSAAPGAGCCSKLATELAVARHLALAGAPVVAPSEDLPPGPHASGGCAISFWRFHDHDPTAAARGRLAGQALAEVHSALDRYTGPVASFLERRVSRTGALLADPGSSASLAGDDRAFLHYEYMSILSRLQEHPVEPRTLHGDPHRGNFLVGGSGYRMIDFESVCSGPREWDLSALPGGGAGVFKVDEELLTLLRRLRSLCVAVWCGTRAARSNELERTARIHLDLLRRAA